MTNSGAVDEGMAMEEDAPAGIGAAERAWAVEWLTGVATGTSPMSQRKLGSVERWGGGLEAVKAVAESLGVHLVELEDDRGGTLIAASRGRFRVIC